MGLELFEANFLHFLLTNQKISSNWGKSHIKFSEGRRQEKYASPANVLPRMFFKLFSEGRRQEKIF